MIEHRRCVIADKMGRVLLETFAIALLCSAVLAEKPPMPSPATPSARGSGGPALGKSTAASARPALQRQSGRQNILQADNQESDAIVGDEDEDAANLAAEVATGGGDSGGRRGGKGISGAGGGAAGDGDGGSGGTHVTCSEDILHTVALSSKTHGT